MVLGRDVSMDVFEFFIGIYGGNHQVWTFWCVSISTLATGALKEYQMNVLGLFWELEGPINTLCSYVVFDVHVLISNHSSHAVER